VAGTNANNPDLSIWVMSFKSSAGSYFTRINFKGSSVDIDRDYLTSIVCVELRSNLSLIDLIAMLGKFFFAISWSNCHHFDLAATLLFYFSLKRLAVVSILIEYRNPHNLFIATLIQKK
jgi:hypothetical protein